MRIRHWFRWLGVRCSCDSCFEDAVWRVRSLTHEPYVTGLGDLIWVHRRTQCSGRCPIHAPTDHHMLDWPTNWRGQDPVFDPGPGHMERICAHEVGHPDPDDRYYEREGAGIHGCDGCCQP